MPILSTLSNLPFTCNEQPGIRNKMATKKIDDAGEFVPYARKHEERFTDEFGGCRSDSVKLSDLWPEPDWNGWIRSGRDPHVVARLALIYRGLPRTPRESTDLISSSEWEDGFRKGMPILKRIIEETLTIEEAKSVNTRYAKALGLDIRALPRNPRDALTYWSVGRGTRRTQSPAKLTQRSAFLAACLADLGWPEDETAYRLSIFAVQLRSAQPNWAVARLVGTRFPILQDGLPTREAALAATREWMAKLSKVKEPGRKQLEGLNRSGPDYRQGNDSSEQELMTTFGFRAVQWGNTLTQRERQIWVNDLYDGLHDLAEVLALPTRWVGMGGVAIAVGARGTGSLRGGSANAHYEPDLRCINYTRMNGAGSVAHELGHALDHRLGTKWYASSYGGYASDLARYGHDIRHKEGFGVQLAEVMEGLMNVIIHGCVDAQTGYSRYFDQACAIERIPRAKKNYWTKPAELFARAFEAFVEDKLEDLGMVSPCLVTGTKPSKETDELSHWAYPLGDERGLIISHFDRLFNLMRRLNNSRPA